MRSDEALEGAAEALGRSGVASPRRNAEALLAKILGCARAGLLAAPERPLSCEEERRFANLCRRRAAREPLEYLLGEAAFAGIVLACDRRALIPRPETEDLVELAARRLAGLTAPRIADLGTGTGALALALAVRLPGADLLATDASAEALSLASENARRLGLDGRVAFRQGADLAPLAGEPPFDALVGNPPYVTEGEFPDLMPEVRDWEPRQALVAGSEGSEVLSRWIASAPPHLAAGGWLALEVGSGQAGPVETLFRSAGFREVSTLRDFAGIGRFVSGRR